MWIVTVTVTKCRGALIEPEEGEAFIHLKLKYTFTFIVILFAAIDKIKFIPPPPTRNPAFVRFNYRAFDRTRQLSLSNGRDAY